MKINPRKLIESRGSNSEFGAHQWESNITIESAIGPRPFALEHLEGLRHFSEEKARGLNLGLEYISFIFPYEQMVRDAIGENHTFYSIAVETIEKGKGRYKFNFIERTDILPLSGTAKEYTEKLREQLLQGVGAQ